MHSARLIEIAGTGPAMTLNVLEPALRQIDGAIVPGDAVDAEHALGAVEQGGDLAARGLVMELLHLVGHRDDRIAHDIQVLVDLEDLIEARIDAGEDLGLVAGLAADAAV